MIALLQYLNLDNGFLLFLGGGGGHMTPVPSLDLPL